MSFSFLNNLFSDLTEDKPRSQRKSKSECYFLETNVKYTKEAILVSKLDDGDIFNGLYKTLRGSNPKRGEGLNQITKLGKDSEKLNSKLRGKNFVLKKNAILRGKKRTKQKMNKKIIKKKKLFELGDLMYKDYEIMIEIWDEYILKLLGTIYKLNDSVYLKMLRADYHGAYLRVEKSKNKYEEGLEGIVLKESLKTFLLLTKENKQKRIIKENIIFSFKVKDKNFIILGAALIYRPDERIRLKPKMKNLIPKLKSILY